MKTCDELVNSLKYHMAAHHNDDEEKNYVCDICGFRTAQKQNLRRHHSVHRKDRKCPYCDVAARHGLINRVVYKKSLVHKDLKMAPFFNKVTKWLEIAIKS